MIDGSEKRNRQLAFELQNSHVCEKRSNEILRTVLKTYNGLTAYIKSTTSILSLREGKKHALKKLLFNVINAY